MLCVSSDRPVDPLTLDVMREVDHLANELTVPYFVTGAMARDILLTGVFGIDTGRATRDVDIAIAVENWAHFEAIKTRLIRRDRFEVTPKVAQRLLFKHHAAQSGYPLDLIPFRGVEDATQSIAWPPERTVVMNVIGYEEALAAAQPVEVAHGFIVPLISGFRI